METNEIGAKEKRDEVENIIIGLMWQMTQEYQLDDNAINWLRSTLTTLTAKHNEEKAAMLQKIYDFGLLDKNERHEAALGWGKEGSDFYKGFIEGAKHVASSVAYQILTIPNCGVIDRPTPDLLKTDVTPTT